MENQHIAVIIEKARKETDARLAKMYQAIVQKHSVEIASQLYSAIQEGIERAFSNQTITTYKPKLSACIF